jgi:hypothetical protein
MVERREPTDTAEILVLLRAQRYADWLAWKDSVNGPRGLPVVFRADTLINVWMFPLVGGTPDSAYVGGERQYIFPADARKELWVAPVSPRRLVQNVPGGRVIKSVGDSVPTFAEVLMANVFAEDHLDVTIELPKYYLKLATSPNAGVWLWIPRKP